MNVFRRPDSGSYGLGLFVTSPISVIYYNCSRLLEYRRLLHSLVCCGYVEDNQGQAAFFCDCNFSSLRFGQAISRRNFDFAALLRMCDLANSSTCVHQQVLSILWRAHVIQMKFPNQVLPGNSFKPGTLPHGINNSYYHPCKYHHLT